MKRSILLIFIFIFVFSCYTTVFADYKATVINPTGATCDVYETKKVMYDWTWKQKSTGLCYYNLTMNDYVDGVVWLDTGDVVTVIESEPTINSTNKDNCADYYVYTSYSFPTDPNTVYNGYYCHANLASTLLTDELKEEFRLAGFPESYWEKLAVLKTAHPNWIFKAVDLNLDFNEAVKAEESLGRSLIQVTNTVNDWGYLNTLSGSYNYYTDIYTPFDGSNWFAANYDTIAYYMDPRNFLIDMYVFQFEALSYDNTITDEVYTATIEEALKNDYLSNFVSIFLEAGKQSLVSPVYLAALSKQEVGGGDQPTTAVSGVQFVYGTKTYSNLYNFYNIGATSSSNPVFNGLYWASGFDYTDTSYSRPWDNPEKSIIGGAIWIGEQYINIGQNTIYFKKWDVVKNVSPSSGENYVHQYQTNIQAPKSEANKVYNSYSSSNILESPFVFYIPVYKNMPMNTSLPRTGNQNNYLSSITINDTNVVGFDGGISEYNYYLDINTEKINIKATSVNSSAQIIGLKEYEIKEDMTIPIHVIAQNGAERIYKINVILTGTKIEEAIDIQTTLNNAGIKNNDKNLSGIPLGSNLNYIEEKIKTVNDKATVEYIKNNNSNRSDVIATGDKVKITIADEVKEYEVIIIGDVNGDGKISAADYGRVKNFVMNKTTIEGASLKAADVNRDNAVKASDYAIIKNTVLGNRVIEQ